MTSPTPLFTFPVDHPGQRYILVLTMENHLRTLLLSDILSIENHALPGHCQVLYRSGPTRQTRVLQEAALTFQQRCLGLQQASLQADTHLSHFYLCPA